MGFSGAWPANWPTGVALQLHITEGDEDHEIAQTLAATVPNAELFVDRRRGGRGCCRRTGGSWSACGSRKRRKLVGHRALGWIGFASHRASRECSLGSAMAIPTTVWVGDEFRAARRSHTLKTTG